nr:O-acyltransferase, WSD1 domain-containing protein [Tanacetum cinerariifolium]
SLELSLELSLEFKQALMITAVSYVDKVTFTVSVDEEIVPDPQKLCDDLQESFYLIKTSVLVVEECV